MFETPSRTSLQTLVDDALPVTATVSQFSGSSGVNEYHLMLTPTAYADTATQLRWMHQAYWRVCAALDLDPGTVVLRRFFCSDLSNQIDVLATDPLAGQFDPEEACAVSLVRQPPAPPAKVAMWAYHVRPPAGPLEKRWDGITLGLQRGELTHLWSTGLTSPEGDSAAAQTMAVLNQYEARLQARGLTVADHVLRTWFFVQHVDANYGGLVTARKAFFSLRGLTPETHFIASTGIEGAGADLEATVMMDAYAIAGVRPEQIRYLAAPDYLCPTHAYGVTFERGVAIGYQDRTHVLISGTASIDADGAILHPGDIHRQLDRTLANIGALLEQGGATCADVGMYLVYVRDPSDLEVVRRRMVERCGSVPLQVVVAPVCRPGWLVEVECQAITAAERPELPAY